MGHAFGVWLEIFLSYPKKSQEDILLHIFLIIGFYTYRFHVRAGRLGSNPAMKLYLHFVSHMGDDLAFPRGLFRGLTAVQSAEASSSTTVRAVSVLLIIVVN